MGPWPMHCQPCPRAPQAKPTLTSAPTTKAQLDFRAAAGSYVPVVANIPAAQREPAVSAASCQRKFGTALADPDSAFHRTAPLAVVAPVPVAALHPLADRLDEE